MGGLHDEYDGDHDDAGDYNHGGEDDDGDDGGGWWMGSKKVL